VEAPVTPKLPVPPSDEMSCPKTPDLACCVALGFEVKPSVPSVFVDDPVTPLPEVDTPLTPAPVLADPSTPSPRLASPKTPPIPAALPNPKTPSNAFPEAIP